MRNFDLNPNKRFLSKFKSELTTKDEESWKNNWKIRFKYLHIIYIIYLTIPSFSSNTKYYRKVFFWNTRTLDWQSGYEKLLNPIPSIPLVFFIQPTDTKSLRIILAALDWSGRPPIAINPRIVAAAIRSCSTLSIAGSGGNTIPYLNSFIH